MSRVGAFASARAYYESVSSGAPPNPTSLPSGSRKAPFARRWSTSPSHRARFPERRSRPRGHQDRRRRSSPRRCLHPRRAPRRRPTGPPQASTPPPWHAGRTSARPTTVHTTHEPPGSSARADPRTDATSSRGGLTRDAALSRQARPLTAESPAPDMDHSWSRAGATGGESARGRAGRKRLSQADPRAAGCGHRRRSVMR